MPEPDIGPKLASNYNSRVKNASAARAIFLTKGDMPDTLPLTHFEELMLYQDSEAYPCSCFIRLQFTGSMLRPAFDAAARATLDRHPLLRAKVQHERGRPRWKIAEHVAPVIYWSEQKVTAAAPRTKRLDLLHETGLRLFVRVDSQRSDLLVQFHHACCDGQGIFQFIHDLLVSYANEAGDPATPAALPKLRAESLRDRGSLGLTPRELLRMAPKQAVGLLGVMQFVMRKPQPIVPHERFAADAPSPETYPALAVHHFDRATSDQVRDAAKRLGVTLNDLLARDSFLALHEYRTKNGWGHDRQWLRLMIPISLRTAGDRSVPAANIVSSVFLDRRGIEIEEAEALLASIQDEMNLIKRLQLRFTFIFSLYANRTFPGGLRKTAAGKSCNTSAVFSNLGKILARTSLPQDDGRLVAANVRLDNISTAAPIAPYLTTAFAVGWYANRLSLTLHHDARLLPPSSAEQLLKMFADRIATSARLSAENAKPSPPAEMIDAIAD